MIGSRRRPAAVFADRRDAGRRLAEMLEPDGPTVVVALPRGGVPVGFEVARALAAPLDVVAVRKLGAPGNAELAVGALAEGGISIVEAGIARRAGATEAMLESAVEREGAELRRQAELFRANRAPLELAGRRAIAVDDGLATGLTMLAAVRALRQRNAGSVTVAVPVAARQSLAALREEADELVCHTAPAELVAVGYWYERFDAVTDDEVTELVVAAAGEAAR